MPEPLRVDPTELRVTAESLTGHAATFSAAHTHGESRAGVVSLGASRAAAALPGKLAEWQSAATAYTRGDDGSADQIEAAGLQDRTITITKTLAAIAVTAGGAALVVATAHADPAAFPDLTAYTPVNPADYTIDTTTPGIASNMVVFLTPDGIPCNFVVDQAQCTGNNFPAVSPVATGFGKGAHVANWIGTSTRLKKTSNPAITGDTYRGQPIRTLPSFHSITFNGMVCGVDDARTTACKDGQGQGFILSPSWSGWLPKV